MRKLPTQARANQTVDAIIEAATQILQNDGEERLNTNRIAERAGVSIGSLYQYFADKEAIIEAIARRERNKILDTIVKSLSEANPPDPESAVREIVRTLIGAFSRRRRARRIIVSMMLRRWQNAPEEQGADEVALMLLNASDHNRSDDMREMTPVIAFVLTRAILGAIRSAVMENSPYLETQQFEDELVHLVKQYRRRG